MCNTNCLFFFCEISSGERCNKFQVSIKREEEFLDELSDYQSVVKHFALCSVTQ